MTAFEERLASLRKEHEALLDRDNVPAGTNGVYQRYRYPVLTADHAPLTWRYDLHPDSNPYLLERFGIHAVFNSGAILWQ